MKLIHLTSGELGISQNQDLSFFCHSLGMGTAIALIDLTKKNAAFFVSLLLIKEKSIALNPKKPALILNQGLELGLSRLKELGSMSKNLLLKACGGASLLTPSPFFQACQDLENWLKNYCLENEIGFEGLLNPGHASAQVRFDSQSGLLHCFAWDNENNL